MSEVASNVILKDKQASKVLNPVKITRLKARDKLFVKKIVKDGRSGTQAYMETRPTNNQKSASVGATRLLKKSSVQQEIERQMESLGLSDEYALTSLQTIIDAGIANAKWTKPSNALHAIRTILELKDRFPAKKQLNANINIDQENMNNASLDELKDQMKNIQEQNKLLLDKLESNN